MTKCKSGGHCVFPFRTDPEEPEPSSPEKRLVPSPKVLGSLVEDLRFDKGGRSGKGPRVLSRSSGMKKIRTTGMHINFSFVACF